MCRQISRCCVAVVTVFGACQGAGLAAAVKHYDEQLAAYAEDNQTDQSRTQTLLVQQALEPCKQELAALEANTQLAGKAPDLPSAPPERSVARQQVSGPWEQILFSGAWETPQLGLKHYDRIRFMLWDNGKGLPEGVAQFFKGRASCVGVLELDAHQQLGFSLFEGEDCDDIDRGRFKLVEGAKKDRMRLSFSPEYAGEESRTQVANLFYMRRMRAIPGALQAYQDRLKGRKVPLRQVFDQLYADLRQGYDARFDSYTGWNMGPLLATQPIKECVPVDRAGRVQLDSSGEQMALFLRSEVVAGTRMLMARFTCDSPEIHRLEQNLLRFRD